MDADGFARFEAAERRTELALWRPGASSCFENPSRPCAAVGSANVAGCSTNFRFQGGVGSDAQSVPMAVLYPAPPSQWPPGGVHQMTGYAAGQPVYWTQSPKVGQGVVAVPVQPFCC